MDLGMTLIARTRAEVDVRAAPQTGAAILDRLPTDCPVEILENLTRWYKVTPSRLLHYPAGYLPQAALVFPPDTSITEFPGIPATTTQPSTPSVPEELKVIDFLTWISNSGKPGWLTAEVWSGLNTGQQADLVKKIQAASVGVKPRWEDWIASLNQHSRLNDALMREWIVIMEGGRDVYALRDYFINGKPVLNSEVLGWTLKGQVLRWNGNVASYDSKGVRTLYLEVDFYRLSRYMHGWFRADLAADYNYPPANLDPAIPANSQTVFDLSRQILRVPQDMVIQDSKKKFYNIAQYIDVFGATNQHLIHWSLCGEFCVAALIGADIIPLLKSWLVNKFWRAPAILKNPHEGTSVVDLQSLLKIAGRKSEIYSSIPTSPQLIKAKLKAHMFAIVGCGINSAGKILPNGKIRHWVVLEDIVPVGNSGWVRVYNPFYNRDEVYNYSQFIESSGAGAGLWIYPKS